MTPLGTVVLYSAGHIGSATILNRLVESDEFEVVGIVKAQTVPLTQKGLQRFRKYLQKTGLRFGWMLFWQQIVQAIAYFVGRLIPGSRRIRPGWKVAEELGIPIYECENVNDDASVKFIESLGPDVLVSAYFNQILKSPVIQIPNRGVLNVHPGWLPRYRGAMAYFWVLRNGEERGGVSVHWIDEGIDTGPILARRQFRLSRGITQQRVLVTTAVIGARLLTRVARQLIKSNELASLTQESLEPAAYFPMPSGQDFQVYSTMRRFFRIRDVFAYLIKNRPRKLIHSAC
ncbi:MAG: hypothetical protein CMJ78_13905 [Planctomycetaceae bacterium]|nr:hypothetical protein [Planctomycetaceae bacterium]